MASRGGRIRISIEGDSSDLSRSVDSANRSLGGLKKGASVGGRALRGIGTAAKYGAAGVAALAVVELPRMIDEAREAQKVGAQTNAVLKSTGGAANVTAQHVADLAEQISLKTAIDDESIQSGQNMLLTFTNVRNEVGKGNDIFDQATQAMVDMSSAMGKDAKTQAIQLGKALNDPIAGISALGRAGVQFSDEQKAMIESLVASGDTLGAQKIILKELETQFAGSAESQATDADKLKVAWANVEEELGTALIPILDDAARALIQFIEEWRKGIGVAGAIRGALSGTVDVIRDVVTWTRNAGNDAWPVLSDAIDATVVASLAVADAAKAAGLAVAGAGRWVANAAKNAVGFVAALWPVKAVAGVVAAVLVTVWNVLKNLAPLIGSVIVRALDIAGAAFKAIWPLIKGFGQIVADVVGIVTNLFRGDFKGAFKNAWDIVKHAMSAIKGTVVGVFKLIVSVIRNAVGLVKDVVRAGWGFVRDQTRTVFNAVADIVRGVVQKIVGFVRGAIDNVKSAASAIGNAIIDGIGSAKQIVTDVAGFIRELPGKIRAGATAILLAGSTIGSKLLSGFMGALRGIGSAILDTFRGPLNTVINWWNNLSFNIDPGRVGIDIPHGPDLSVDIPGISLGTPNIPTLATGAVLDGATLAVIGEAGREYVIPVENNREAGRQLLMDAAAELGVPLLAGGARPKPKGGKNGGKGHNGGKGGKGGKGVTQDDVDLSDVTEASSRLNALLAAHAAATRDLTGLSALWAPAKPAWADPTKYAAADGTFDDLQTADDLMRYWDNQIEKLSVEQQVKVGETWKTYKKDVTKKVKGKRGKDGKRGKPTEKVIHKKGDEIAGTRKPVYWTGILYDELENALNESAGWRDYIAGLFEPLDGTTGAGGNATSAEAMQQVIDAQATLNESLVRELAIRNAQDPVLANFLGSFDNGGVVPGPRGAAGWAQVHGGETILPTHRGDMAPAQFVVQIHGDRALPSLIDRVEVVEQTGQRAGLGLQSPSAAGVKARYRNTRRVGSKRG